MVEEARELCGVSLTRASTSSMRAPLLWPYNSPEVPLARFQQINIGGYKHSNHGTQIYINIDFYILFTKCWFSVDIFNSSSSQDLFWLSPSTPATPFSDSEKLGSHYFKPLNVANFLTPPACQPLCTLTPAVIEAWQLWATYFIWFSYWLFDEGKKKPNKYLSKEVKRKEKRRGRKRRLLHIFVHLNLAIILQEKYTYLHFKEAEDWLKVT